MKEEREKIQNERDLLATIFTKLCFSENDNDISEIVDVSEVIPSRDLNFFKKGSRLIPENDKRFHYEDDILQPSILDSGEKSNPRIVHELIEDDNSSEDANER